MTGNLDLRLMWLGQSGFVLHSGGFGVVIDPFLSAHEARLSPPPDAASLPARATVLVTHGHGDHLDPPGLRQLLAQAGIAEVIAPTPHEAIIRAALPIAVTNVQPGDAVERGPFAVRVSDGLSPGPTPHVGYVISAASTVLYVSGDTVATDPLAAELRGFDVDVAVLPINGRDADREQAGIVGNLDGDEAAAFAAAIGATVLVPCHYDMIAGNTGDVDSAVAAAARLCLQVLVPPRDTFVDLTPSVMR